MKIPSSILLLCLVAIAANAAPSDDDGRIVNGVAINIKKASFMVRLTLPSGTFCGGSLIAPNYVLTAAHCLDDEDVSKIIVKANITNIDETGIQRKVKRWVVHDKYFPEKTDSDLAVIELDKPIKGLPNLKLSERLPKEGEKIQVFGWGATGEKSAGSKVLRTVSLPVRSMDDCRREYQETVKKNMFCASGLKDVGTCFGDSGGPAVIGDRVYGIVAFSYDCGVAGSSEVYSNVYEMSDFIKKAMKK